MATKVKQYDLESKAYTTTGTASAYELTIPKLDALYDELTFVVEFHVANDASATLEINSLWAIAIMTSEGNAVDAGDLKTTGRYTLVYDQGTWTAIVSETVDSEIWEYISTHSWSYKDYELWENIPAWIYATAVLEWEVDEWFIAIPTLSIQAEDPAGEDIWGVNYKVTTTLTNLIGSPYEVFDGNSATEIITNTVQVGYLQLEMSVPIRTNRMFVYGDTDNISSPVEYSTDWATWVPISNIQSNPWYTGGAYYDFGSIIEARFWRVQLTRTPTASFDIKTRQFNKVTEYATPLLYMTDPTNTIFNYSKFAWFVVWPKTAWDIVSVSNIEWTVVDWFTGLTEWVDYFTSDTIGGIDTTPATDRPFRIWYALSDTKLIITEKRLSTQTENKIIGNRFSWYLYYGLATKWNFKICGYYNSGVWWDYWYINMYIIPRNNPDISTVTPISLPMEDIYNPHTLTNHLEYQSMQDVYIVLQWYINDTGVGNLWFEIIY